MYGCKVLDSFQINYHCSFNEKVEPTFADAMTFVQKLDVELPLKPNAAQRHFDGHSFLVSRLQMSRS